MPGLLRRHGANLARASWLARGLSTRRAFNEEVGLDEEDLWDSVVDGVDMGAADDQESAIESLAMDLTGSARSRLESRRRFLEAARAFSNANRELQPPPAADLLRSGIENASSYQPRWANPLHLCSQGRSGNSIEVGEGERQNVAHLPTGSGEGRAIRTENPLPGVDSPFGALGLSMNGTSSDSSRTTVRRRSFGFKVAFDHPTAEVGGGMGGCYLVGVTTAAFAGYCDENALQESPFFWGIEDSGQKYEGPRQSSTRSDVRRPSHGVEVGPQDAPRNSSNVLFGSRDVVTVICDLDTRSLTFWRNDTALGTLITNIPQSGSLFPAAVPFNCGVTVAITGLDGDPLPL